MKKCDYALVELFEGSINPERIVTQLELLFGFDIKPAETLIIFDEVQEIPRALTSLKYFCEFVSLMSNN